MKRGREKKTEAAKLPLFKRNNLVGSFSGDTPQQLTWNGVSECVDLECKVGLFPSPRLVQGDGGTELSL
jgi:hypothetical protein